jgi:glycine/D-amino acid oxidase-like deaminating enzyme
MSKVSIQPSDFVVIGGGIAGASVGYWLAAHGRVTEPAWLSRRSGAHDLAVHDLPA